MDRLTPRLRFAEKLTDDPFARTRVLGASEVVRMARLWSDLTQSEVGRRTGIRQQTISAWERGLQEPSFAAVMAVLGACEMDLCVIPFAREGELDIEPARVVIPGQGSIPRSGADRQLRRVRSHRAAITQYRSEKEGYGGSRSR